MELNEKKGKRGVSCEQSFIDSLSSLSADDVSLALNYPYSKIANYISGIVTDEEINDIEGKAATNVLLKERIATVRYIMNTFHITDFEGLHQHMKKSYNIEID